MTTMTNFSTTAERIGKTASEKRAVEAMANALGSVENAITDGDTHYEGHCFIDDAEQYASEGLDSLDKRTLNHISDERINELVHEVALTFDYLEEYNEPATSPEANNDKENAMTAPQTSVFVPSYAASMSFEDFIDGMYLFASKSVGYIAFDRVAIRVESLYNNITFRTMVFEYRQAVLARDDRKKRMFRSMVTGDIVYTADDWDNDIYSSKVKAYGDVLYDMLVRLPKNAENERKSLEKLCK
ncbi:MAG: hypothetical protein KHY47_01290 [Prevotella sp.]|nr:hypothetical protein [Prevotella sp.]